MSSDIADLFMRVDSTGVVASSGHLKRFKDEAGDAQRSASRFGESAKRGFGAARIAAGALLGTMVGIGASVATLSRFDESMARVAAISGAASDELSAMRDVAKDLGSTTEFSASQAADALGFLSMAGFSASESISAIPAVLDLATASALGLSETADITSNIMSGFGIAAQNTATVTDVLSKASSIANTNVSQLGLAMSYAAPVANSLGVSIGDTAAAIGVLSDSGVQGGRAGSTLRAILTRLVAPSDAAATAMERLGVSLDEIDPTANSLSSILERLSRANLDLATATELVGMEAASNLLVLTEGNAAYAEYSDTLKAANGATEAMAKTMRDQLGGSIKGLQSSVEGLIIAMGDAGLTAVLTGIIDGATAVVRALTSLTDNTDMLAIGLGVLAASKIPALIAGLLSLATWLGTVEGLFIAGAVASRSLAVAMNLIPGVALFTGLTVALTGIYRGFSESARAAEEYAARINDLAQVQDQLNSATDRYYQNMTRSNLDAMRIQAERARDAVAAALEAAEAELQAAGWYTRLWGDTNLFDTQRMKEAQAEIDKLSAELIGAEARLSAADNAATNFERSLGEASTTIDDTSQVIRSVGEAVFKAIPALDELQKRYGANAEAARAIIKAQNELAKIDMSASISGVLDSALAITDALDLGIDKAAFFAQHVERIRDIDAFSRQAVALLDMAQYIELVTGGIGNMDQATRAVYESLLQAADNAAELGQQISVGEANATALGRAIGGIAPQFAPAILAANNLAKALGGVVSQIGAIGQGLAAMSPIGSAVSSSIEGLGTSFERIKSAGVAGASGLLSEIGENLKDVWSQAQTGRASVDDLTATLSSKFTPAATSAGRAAGGGLSRGLSDAERAAQRLREELERPMVRAIDGVSNAWGDFVASGFKDFDGFVRNVLSSFTNMISQMIAQAAQRRITFNLGLGDNPGTSAGQSGGLLSRLKSGAGIFGRSGFFGQIGTSIGESIGTALGGAKLASTLGSIGSAVGSVLPVIGLAAAAFSFFKTKTTELDAGIRVTTMGMSALVDTFRTVEKVKFFGLSKKIQTSYEEAEAAVAGPIQSAVTTIGERVTALADVLGLAASNITNTSFEFEVSTQGKSDAEIQEAIEAELTRLGNTFADAVIGSYTEYLPDQSEIDRINEQIAGLGSSELIGGRFEGRLDSQRVQAELELQAAQTSVQVVHLNEAFADLQREGEGSLELLERMVANLGGVNETLILFDRATLAVDSSGAMAATRLVDLAGGLDAFSSQSQFVFQNLLTGSAQEMRLIELASQQLSETFGDLQRAVPGTHAEFMALLDAQDLTTDAGRETYASLLSVAEAFVTVNGTAQEAADSLESLRSTQVATARDVAAARTSQAQSAISDAENALRSAFSTEQQRVSDAYDKQIAAVESAGRLAELQAETGVNAARDRVTLLTSIADALESAFRDRRVLDPIAEQMRLASATSFLRRAVDAGGTSDLGGLQRALQDVADPSMDLFDSFEEYRYAYAVNTALIDKLRQTQGETLTVEERALAAAESQLTAISDSTAAQIAALDSARDQELTRLDQQLDALLGIDASIMSLTQAISGYEAAQREIDRVVAPAPDPVTEFAPGSWGAQLNEIYNRLLGRDVREPGIDFYGGTGLSLEAIEADIAQSAERQQYLASVSSGAQGGGEVLAEMRRANDLAQETAGYLRDIQIDTERSRQLTEEQYEESQNG